MKLSFTLKRKGENKIVVFQQLNEKPKTEVKTVKAPVLMSESIDGDEQQILLFIVFQSLLQKLYPSFQLVNQEKELILQSDIYLKTYGT